MHRKYIFILIMLLAVATATCAAQTWDATRDFEASNPNGAWSYGDGVTGTSFQLYSTYNQDCGDLGGVQGFVCWTAELIYHVPQVGFNTTGGWLNTTTNGVFPPDALIIHPGPDWDPQDSIVRWTAAVAGYYKISGFFEICDTNPSGIIGLVFRNGTLLYSGELLGPPAQHPDKVGGREDFNFAKLFLNAGDVISFGVNSDGTFSDDSTGFNATITKLVAPCIFCSPPPAQPFAYVTNSNSDSVSVIDTASNTVVDTIAVEGRPIGVAFTPDGSRAYVANSDSNSVSVIDTVTRIVFATVAAGSYPEDVAITPDGSRAYVGNTFSDNVSVIDTASNTVVATVPVESYPLGMAITPDGSRTYVANAGSDSVSVIDTTRNTVVATVAVGDTPWGVGITPDGSRAYVPNFGSNSISVIDTATNTVVLTIENVPQPVAKPAVTPDGTRVYVVSNTAAVFVIDTASDTVIATIAIGPYPQNLAITPDGSHAYVASFDSNSVYVIDTATNTVSATVGVQAAPVGVAITPATGPRQPARTGSSNHVARR